MQRVYNTVTEKANDITNDPFVVALLVANLRWCDCKGTLLCRKQSPPRTLASTSSSSAPVRTSTRPLCRATRPSRSNWTLSTRPVTMIYCPSRHRFNVSYAMVLYSRRRFDVLLEWRDVISHTIVAYNYSGLFSSLHSKHNCRASVSVLIVSYSGKDIEVC